MAVSATGTQSQIRVEGSVTASSPASIWSDVTWYLYFEETGNANLAYDNTSTIPASVVITSLGTVWSGVFNFDWRPGGTQSVLVASGTSRVYHSSDGTPPASFTITGNTGNTGTGGGGSGATVGMGLSLATLKVLPSVPSAVSATRVSDTQIQINWTNAGATNGQATQNIIQKRVNNGAWDGGTTITVASTTTLASSPDEKWEYRVAAINAAGTTAYSAITAAVYTTPDAPTAVTAIKDASLNIVVGFTANVAYSEHSHEVWHGTVTAGVTTWDGAALTTLASGVLTYTHATPNPAQIHIYRVRAVTGALASAYASSPSVQLLAAPNKPTIPALAAYADKAAIFTFSWIHNPVDSTAQTKRQVRYSTDGGTTWNTLAKTVSTALFLDFAANTWAANVAVTFQVRTKGSYDSGADADPSYSPWSDSVVVTFKTLPVATITAPATGGTLTDATVRATLGFTQAEAATYVKAQLELKLGAAVLESLESVLLTGITPAYAVQNGVSYTLRARVQDSNGLWSAWVTSAFSVTYSSPVSAVLTLTYLSDTGYGQIDLSIAGPSGPLVAATTVTITRAINGGVAETIVRDYPVSALLTFLDTTPAIRGTNAYVVTTKSALGAQASVSGNLVTAETRRAFLSKGAGFSTVAVFGANMSVSETLGVTSGTIQAAGRLKPIGLYGVETAVQLKVQSFIYEGFGSTVDQIRDILLLPGKACYRDSSGRRIFGAVKGSVAYDRYPRGTLSFTLNETS